MPTRVEDEWSDSDEEYDSSGDVETNVQLGIPDGPIATEQDLKDPRVSRIGGHPVFLVSSPPDVSVSQCKNCSNPMQLVSQIWCPIEDSPLDRAMYIWACANGKCQKKDGSVRAWRCVRFNKKYAEKLERKATRKEQEKEAEKSTQQTGPKSNPFSLGNSAAATSPFGLGSQIFGATTEEEGPTPPEPEFEDDSDSDSDDSEDSEDTVDEEADDLAEALAKTTLSDVYTVWKDMPSYPPLYLSTISEYLPPEPKAKANIKVDDGLGDGKTKGGLEAYENSMNLDEVFSRFIKRVECEGEQCIRYELGGNPLPYHADVVFQRLFPTLQPGVVKRAFSSSSLPKCSRCGSDRVFECQLMPNMINILGSASAKGSTLPSKAISDEERRKAVEKELKERSGMEWGTAMVFSCAADCCPDGKEHLAEEEVLIQWETQ